MERNSDESRYTRRIERKGKQEGSAVSRRCTIVPRRQQVFEFLKARHACIRSTLFQSGYRSRLNRVEAINVRNGRSSTLPFPLFLLVSFLLPPFSLFLSREMNYPINRAITHWPGNDDVFVVVSFAITDI